MEPSAPVDVVQVDGLVVLKMITHARKTSFPPDATGALLGMELEGRLEITNFIPHSSNANEDDNEAYQLKMMEALRKVNVDHAVVGWFMSAYIKDFLTMNKNVLEVQYSYQAELPSSVCLHLDPYRKGSNQLGLKAFRLKEEFMKVFAGADFTQASFDEHKVTPLDIIEEVPIQVHNSHLVHAFLYELRENKLMSTDHDRLNIHVNPFVEKQLDSLSQCIDEYQQQQSTLLYHERSQARQKAEQKKWQDKRDSENELRRKQGKTPLPDDKSKLPQFKQLAKPYKIETYLISNRMARHCDSLLSDTAQGLSKLYCVDALN